MATFILLDRGTMDPWTSASSPLGGAESAFIDLARALARRGHRIEVRNHSPTERDEGGLHWASLDGAPLPRADLLLANRDPALLSRPGPLGRRVGRRVLWLHNTARYLLFWRSLRPLLRHWPTLVFSGAYHRSTYPRWAPGGPRRVIPYGTPEPFLSAAPAERPPPPRAIFTSNPLRSLDWLIDLWVRDIHPRVPGSELHLFSGPSTYGSWGAKVASRMEAVLARAHAAADRGVVVRAPVPKGDLVEELRRSRALLYRGDVEETFCLAVAEAQAVGVPAVVQDLGSMAERVSDGETGFVASGDREFADRAVALLTDDRLWGEQHRAAIDRQRQWTWNEAARAFEELLP